MMPSMRSVWIVVAICGLFFSCLAATGCGDDITSVETCDEMAQILCGVLDECFDPSVTFDECLPKVVEFCEYYGGIDNFDIKRDMTCEEYEAGQWLPEEIRPPTGPN